MDLDEILRVDRCRDMDELVTFESHPDHSPDAGTGKSKSRRSVEVGQTGTPLKSRLQLRGCTAERYCLLHVVVQGQEVSQVGRLCCST